MNSSDKKQLIDYCCRAKNKGLNSIYLHWTAGRYDQVFDDYHACIKGDGEVYFMTDNLAETKDHTYRRNSNSIGIALCCALGATANKVPPHNFGDFPPTTAQIETVSETMAIISRELDIPIDIQHMMTHAEAADNLDGAYPHDPYGPDNGCERWDLWHLQDYDGQWKPGGEVLRGKALFYKNTGNL